jgi:hypothetical protein
MTSPALRPSSVHHSKHGKVTALGTFETKQVFCAQSFTFFEESMLRQKKNIDHRFFWRTSIIFLHEQGLAMELSGMFYKAIGNKEAAKISLMGAQACYLCKMGGTSAHSCTRRALENFVK